MAKLRNGAQIVVPKIAGKWSVWSQTDDTVGAHALVPANEEARQTKYKFIVVKVTHKRTVAEPMIEFIRGEK